MPSTDYSAIGSGPNVPIFPSQAYPNHENYWEVTGTPGSGGSLFEPFYRNNDGIFEMSINGGILPLSDDDILVMSPAGPLAPSSDLDEFHWTADRVSIPNRILLNEAPEDSNNYAVLIQNY